MKFALRQFATVAVLLALFVVPAFGGPPLVCHTFDIGDAKSLPWTSHNWNLTGTESYNTKNLPADTMAILDSESTVLVHMETLRRTALYGQKDPDALKQLLLRLVARNDVSRNTHDSALATFDVGYLAAILAQVHWINKSFANPAEGLDPYSLVKQALELQPNDPQMQFAAALITLDGPASDHYRHAQKTLAGAKTDPLLARNLSTHFISPQSETMAELISRNTNVKVAQP